MKKLSIGLTAFAEDASSTEATTVEETTEAAPANIEIEVLFVNVDGSEESVDLSYVAAADSTVTADDILAAVKSRLNDDYSDLVDAEEYVLSETVVAYDNAIADNGDDADEYVFTSAKVESGETYYFTVVAYEIDDVKNLAVTIGEQLAKIDWAGITKYNVALINEIIDGIKAAVDSLVNADWPECTEKPEETTTEVEETTVPAEETPDTGVSAVAGAAVVVLALSATTAVVLRKKED